MKEQSRADWIGIDVGVQKNGGPDAGTLADGDAADELRAWVNVGGLRDRGRGSGERANHDWIQVNFGLPKAESAECPCSRLLGCEQDLSPCKRQIGVPALA